ncbi:unnamed protein product, partial [Mesorhabditis spiculigera]
MARVPALLLLACLLGFYLINVARADCYNCMQGDLETLGDNDVEKAIWLAILDGVEVSSDCENVKDSTKKCTGTNKCSHAHLEKKNDQAIIKQLEIRTCATGFLLTNWTTGYQRKEIPGSHLTVTEQACEGDLCNKLPMTELKQRAEEAAKHSSTASYLVLPVVTFFASNILAFF